MRDGVAEGFDVTPGDVGVGPVVHVVADENERDAVFFAPLSLVADTLFRSGDKFFEKLRGGLLVV
jgi:hypothetical protein